MKTRVAVSVAIASVMAFPSVAAERVDFSNRPLLAGRASLTETGYVESRSLGVARLSPELTMPIELVYESYSEKTGAFGFAWRSPQLESSAAWDKDGVLWTSPWGEKVKFFPKSEKPPKDAVKIEVVEEAKRGRGYFAPYSEWEADVSSGKPETGGNWVVRGRKSLVGWTFPTPPDASRRSPPLRDAARTSPTTPTDGWSPFRMAALRSSPSPMMALLRSP